MKVKAKMDFFDWEHDLKIRKKDSVFETDKKRAEKLVSFGVAEIVENETEVNTEKKG